MTCEIHSVNDSKIQQRFDRKFAETVAEEIIDKLQDHLMKYLICGSIRRQKSTVGDIDIVAVPKSVYALDEESLSDVISKIDPDGGKIAKSLGKSGAKRFLNGDLIKRFQYKGISIDLYLADEATFGTLVLIRTGSKEHNIKLTKIARSKGLKLFASGKGLCQVDDKDNVIKIINVNENEILSILLNYVPDPRDRD